MCDKITWNTTALYDIFSSAFTKAKDEQAYFDHEQLIFNASQSREVQKIRRRQNASISIAKKDAYQQQIQALVPTSYRQPPSVYTEVKELGYNWDHPEAYETTGINGIDSDFFSILPDQTIWDDPLACTTLILQKTSKYIGWREMHIEGGWKGLHIQVYGGRYVRPYADA